MPTIFAHSLIPASLKFALQKELVSGRLFALGILASVIPDLDVIAFKFGIPYGSQWGHRGFTHSFFFAFCLALAASSAAKYFLSGRLTAFVYIFISSVSHPILDSFTNGGKGCALYWPFRTERIFFSWRPIEVSPIGANFFSERGLAVIYSEICWVGVPVLLMSILVYIINKIYLRFRRA
ncbi:MAG TPA: metal-dependent hydrolase [Leptospiraceae bacterium]|nr:metal-dependent hydrolase [Leptospiraceae bacterium]